MIASNIAKRYARAFFDVEDRHERCYDELKRFVGVLETNRRLKDFLSNPVFENKDKKAVVGKVLQMLNISPSTANFLNLLVDKRRIGVISEIEDAYRKLMDNALGIARVQVKTAFSLSPGLSDSLKRGLESFTGKQVDMQVEEDASLLGGIVVRVGDKLYDGSIKMQLNNMMKLLGDVHVESR
ncbi:MAG: ATP synthase F1 subunit delta [Syntrophobacteraceae bacterium CG23_combo_of_CG06-09_8_20_14_all_50_8]|nr:MAG: ATP synthase F1 subunit delta [Syntrophobacteraceae bacterium CG23_combo_of_CG06-09_8_20_14_all_50_8]